MMDEMRRMFSDVWVFEEMVVAPLRTMLNDVDWLFPCEKVWAGEIVKRYMPDFHVHETRRAKIREMELIFAAAYVRIYQKTTHRKIEDKTAFLEAFPSFKDVAEIDILYSFYANILDAKKVIKDMRFMNFCIALGARLEGADQEYVLGSKPRKEVQRRIQIHKTISFKNLRDDTILVGRREVSSDGGAEKDVPRPMGL